METERQETINAYKCELKKYSFYYHRYHYWEDIEYLAQHEEEGLLGKDLSQEMVQGSSDPNNKAIKRLKLIEDREHAEKMKNIFKRKMVAIENTLRVIEKQEDNYDGAIAKAIMNVYCKKTSTAEREGRMLGMSRRMLIDRMDAAIEKFALRTLENELI